MEQILIRRTEAATMLGISTDTLDVLANKGHIQKIKIGARTCYLKDDILRFAHDLARKGAVSLA